MKDLEAVERAAGKLGRLRKRTVAEMSEEERNGYRQCLVDCQNQGIDEYCKTVLTLSAAALGISLTFTKDIVKPERMVGQGWLQAAWCLWGISTLFVLFSYYTSYLANSKALDQFDEGLICDEPLGGIMNFVTKVLNPLSGALFLAGVVSLAIFVNANLSHAKQSAQTEPSTLTTNTTAIKAAVTATNSASRTAGGTNSSSAPAVSRPASPDTTPHP